MENRRGLLPIDRVGDVKHRLKITQVLAEVCLFLEDLHDLREEGGVVFALDLHVEEEGEELSEALESIFCGQGVGEGG